MLENMETWLPLEFESEHPAIVQVTSKAESLIRWARALSLASDDCDAGLRHANNALVTLRGIYEQVPLQSDEIPR
ncbi:MAG: hypothetical protein M2R46_05158 [Verrucomicrobia subdivision 3 bacterium]|nr:hypothetical protein [Limisphaerales bacterium]